MADAIGATPAAISQWGEYPPPSKQLLLERLSNGALVAEPGCLDKIIGLDKVPPPAAEQAS